ncbi:hypothetical protein DFQ30_007593 [Apophysomyces sp. BC1015]|nr:hypothetical protein DFQ30_007593 [Apophysomyces sp. BC1015]
MNATEESTLLIKARISSDSFDTSLSGPVVQSTWVNIEARKELYNAIVGGNIQHGLTVIKQHFPTLLPAHIQYKLHCQQFIETVRSSASMEAIEYAHMHLVTDEKQQWAQLIEIAPLIAYTNPQQSGVKHLLAFERRIQLADEVNQTILAQFGIPKETSLERVMKQMALVREELEKNACKEQKMTV